MKKIGSIILLCILLLGITGCKNQGLKTFEVNTINGLRAETNDQLKISGVDLVLPEFEKEIRTSEGKLVIYTSQISEAISLRCYFNEDEETIMIFLIKDQMDQSNSKQLIDDFLEVMTAVIM